MQRQTSRHPLDRPVWSALEPGRPLYASATTWRAGLRQGLDPLRLRATTSPRRSKRLKRSSRPASGSSYYKPMRPAFREGQWLSTARPGFKWC